MADLSNARMESFIKTLKSEEVWLKQYRDLDHARTSIGHFLEDVYNRRRLHSALGYRPPAEFEQAWLAQNEAGAVKCSSL